MIASLSSKPAVELRHLQTFLIVAEMKSFSKAAEHLGVSQPPLSRQVKRLEAKLNVKLFDRSRAQIQLTEAGKVFAQSARRIIAQVEQGIYDAQRVSQGITGEIAIGIDSRIVSCDHLIQFIYTYQTRFPDLRIQINELAAQAQIEALRSHTISLGFAQPWRLEALSSSLELASSIELASSAELATHVIAHDTLSVVLPAFHPLAISPSLSFTDIVNEDVIMNQQWQQHLSNIAQQQQESFTPNIVQSASTPQLILSFVAADKGITVLPSSTKQQYPHTHLVYKPLQLTTPFEVLSLLWRQEDTHSSLRAFVQALMRENF